MENAAVVAREAAGLISRMTRSEAVRLAGQLSKVPWVRGALGRYIAGEAGPLVLVLGSFRLAGPLGIPWLAVMVGVSEDRREAVVSFWRDASGWASRTVSGQPVPWARYAGDPAGGPGPACQGDVPWLGGAGPPDENRAAAWLTYWRGLASSSSPAPSPAPSPPAASAPG